jgi:biopolymer transport protein ExbB
VLVSGLVPTLALAQDEASPDWLALLKLGGPVVLILLLMSVVALAVSLYKLIQFRSFSTRSLSAHDRAVSLWCSGQRDEARHSLGELKSPIAEMLHRGMQWLAVDSPDREEIQAELTRMARQILARLSSLLGILEQVAYLAPLLGLLGTVLGIIDVFHGLADQGSSADAGSLAGGIWEALLTTAVGLCVAIPFALLHAAMESRLATVRSHVEDQLTRLFTAGLYAGDDAEP